MATYSVGFGGIAADAGPSATKNIALPDDYARPAGQAYAMSQGALLSCRGPDGAAANYKIDAERSDPDKGLIYLVKQGP